MNYATIRLVTIGSHTSQPDWKLGPQRHDQHEIVVIASGRQSAQIESVTHAVGVGDVLWFPQNVPHAEQADPTDPVRSLFLSVDWPELPRPPVLRITDTDGRIGQLARWLYAERERDPAPDRPIATALTQAIVAEYLRLATQPADPLIGKLRKFMRQHYRRSLALDDLAKASGLSKFHFLRRYRTLTGRTPMEDLRLIRLEAARDLLLTTNLPLKEIAPRCGLGDEYHLARLFRRQFGTSSRQLRHRPPSPSTAVTDAAPRRKPSGSDA